MKWLLTLSASVPVLAAAVFAACSTPGLDICHDGTSNVACSTPANNRWTYSDGTPINTPYANASQLSDADYRSCYCQQATSFQEVAESHVLVTKCAGQLFYVGGIYNTEPPEKEGYAYWFDGYTMMTSNFDPINVATKHMDCRAGLSYGSSSTPSRSGSLIYITWVAPVSKIESPLPSNAAYDPNGLCPGYDAQADDHPNPASSSGTVTISASDATNCTCVTDTNVLISDGGTGEDLHGNSFATICSSDYKTYWNGQGYRKVRVAVRDPDNSDNIITDQCSARSPSGAAVYVASLSSSPGGGTGGSSSSSSSSRMIISSSSRATSSSRSSSSRSSTSTSSSGSGSISSGASSALQLSKGRLGTVIQVTITASSVWVISLLA